MRARNNDLTDVSFVADRLRSIHMDAMADALLYLDETDDVFESNALGYLIAEELDPEEMTDILIRAASIYRSVPEEVRQNRLSEEYLSKFDELKTPEYQKIYNKLQEVAGFLL